MYWFVLFSFFFFIFVLPISCCCLSLAFLTGFHRMKHCINLLIVQLNIPIIFRSFGRVVCIVPKAQCQMSIDLRKRVRTNAERLRFN